MSLAGTAEFTFEYSVAEIREGTRAAQKAILRVGRASWWRLAQIITLALAAGLTGFVLAPLLLGPMRLVERVFIAESAFVVLVLGCLVERVAFNMIARDIRRRQRPALALPRHLTLSASGLSVETGAMLHRHGWAELAGLRRGRSLLLLLLSSGGWVGIPLRLLPDGPEPIERTIDGWRGAA